MFNIIKLNQETEWSDYVKRAANFDFYHTWYYHSMDNTGDPILIVYHEGEDFIAFPLIKRKIPESDCYDLTCVYGYTGPISNKEFADLDACMVDNFCRQFHDFLKTERNISIFSRLHPFFNQCFLLKNFEGMHENGKTVVIDLQISIEEQRSKYQRRVLEKVRQLRRKGYYVKEGKSKEEIKAFAAIYMENMKRIGAADFYLFTDVYFKNLFNSEEFDSRLLTVYLNDKAVCGAVVICTQKIIQAHLLGTSIDYLKDSPAKLLTDEISIMGRKLGMKYFNLGGGLGFKQDSLFEWKAGFSDLHLDFTSWRYIVDKNTYHLLIDKCGLTNCADVDFFPLYRYVAK